MNKLTIILFLLLSISFSSNAQLSFPKGNTLNLNTNLDYLYLETEILFHTGSYIVDDYRWEKVYDSIDNRWQVHSCFNGDCWNDRPETSNFVAEFGENDTTGFIRFHVWSYNYDGSLNIKYKVINNKDSLDQSILNFHISFNKLSGIEQTKSIENSIQLYPNPASSTLHFRNSNFAEFKSIRITDIQNKLVFESIQISEEIDISYFPKGFYIVSLVTTEEIITRIFCKN